MLLPCFWCISLPRDLVLHGFPWEPCAPWGFLCCRAWISSLIKQLPAAAPSSSSTTAAESVWETLLRLLCFHFHSALGRKFNTCVFLGARKLRWIVLEELIFICRVLWNPQMIAALVADQNQTNMHCFDGAIIALLHALSGYFVQKPLPLPWGHWEQRSDLTWLWLLRVLLREVLGAIAAFLSPLDCMGAAVHKKHLLGSCNSPLCSSLVRGLEMLQGSIW